MNVIPAKLAGVSEIVLVTPPDKAGRISPEALAAFLGSIPAIETPWDGAFHRLYCSSCSAADCDDCRRPERDSPLWWLGLPAAEAEK